MTERGFKIIEGEDLKSRHDRDPAAFTRLSDYLAASDVAGQMVAKRRDRIGRLLSGESRSDESSRITHMIGKKVIAEGRDTIQGVLGDRLREAAKYNDQIVGDAVSKNRAAAIEVDGQLAASGVYMEWAQVSEGLPTRTLNGRKIYMLTKGTTLPDFEGRGYNKALRKRRIEMILKEDPDAYILAITKEPFVKKQHPEPKWKRSTICALLDQCDDRQCTQAKYDYYKNEAEKEGYEAFLLDPKELQE